MGRIRGANFPAFVHPNPLFGMAQEHSFENRVVAAGVFADGFVNVLAFDKGEGFFKTQDVAAIGFTPTGGGDDWRAGV